MNFTLTIILLGIIILLTHFLEGITGFGCTVIAMPFAILLIGLDAAKPVLTVMGFLLTLYVVITDYKHIVWKEYIIIIIYMLIGMPIGLIAFNFLPKNILIIILSIFMIIISIRGLINIFFKINLTKKISPFILKSILIIAGCIHGAFTTGGPLLIIYAIKKIHNKNNFRATLCLVWTTLNLIIIVENFVQGIFSTNVIKISIFMLPFLIIGALLGNWAHYKIKDKYFSPLVYIVLFISAIFMLM